MSAETQGVLMTSQLPSFVSMLCQTCTDISVTFHTIEMYWIITNLWAASVLLAVVCQVHMIPLDHWPVAISGSFISVSITNINSWIMFHILIKLYLYMCIYRNYRMALKGLKGHRDQRVQRILTRGWDRGDATLKRVTPSGLIRHYWTGGKAAGDHWAKAQGWVSRVTGLWRWVSGLGPDGWLGVRGPHEPYSQQGDDPQERRNETWVSTLFAGTGSKPPESDLMLNSLTNLSITLGMGFYMTIITAKL